MFVHNDSEAGGCLIVVLFVPLTLVVGVIERCVKQADQPVHRIAEDCEAKFMDSRIAEDCEAKFMDSLDDKQDKNSTDKL